VDYYKNGKLTIEDFKRMMQRNGFHPTDTELSLLNRRFDRNLQGFITYQEFMDEILPRTSLLG
jgi:Ca2+-binding EF-hand superfamily protein